MTVEMSREDFEDLVEDTLEEIPDSFWDLIDNVAIFVEDEPPEGMESDLLGLYEGIALTERDDYSGALPDRIVIFRYPTLRMCQDADEVAEEVRITVIHEVAHHFGIDDDRLHELGWA